MVLLPKQLLQLAAVIAASRIVCYSDGTSSRTKRYSSVVDQLGELSNRFVQLKSQVMDEFNVLKTMLLNVEDKLRDQGEKVRNQHRKLQKAIANSRHGRGGRHNGGYEYSPYSDPRIEGPENFDHHSFASDSRYYDRMSNDYSNSDVYHHNDLYQPEDNYEFSAEVEDVPSPRSNDILKYNASIHRYEDGRRAFTYYWEVMDIIYKSQNWGWRRSIRSNSFHIYKYGYMMYLRLYPNQEGKNIYIHVGLTKGEYDSALDWPFRLKHKVQILDHSLAPQDITSRVWDPKELCSEWNWRRPDSRDNYECVGLGFPQTTLKYRDYLHNGAIVVKLTVYLD